MDSNHTIETLFQRYLDNECSPEEIKTLLQYFKQDKKEDLLRSLIMQQLEKSEAEGFVVNDFLLKANFLKIRKAIFSDRKKVQVMKPFYLHRWFKLSAAAVVILFLTSTAYFLNSGKEAAPLAQNKIKISHTDIEPGQNNAILTLDNGETIMLDSAANGTLAHQGNCKVMKINGQIAYNKTGNTESKTVYNTITTANGNQFQLLLTDGSKVWLNAASSIRFPTTFTGKERKVEITGEVYFEVAKNPAKPFKVNFKNKSGGQAEIEVLGTHFNVSTYSDEPEIKTTLLEGSVKIKNANAVQILSPAQQAGLTTSGIEVRKNVDMDQVMAWKNGYFLFNNSDIYSLMRQVSRWYNVDVKYEGRITQEGFSGKISREVPLSKLIKVLQLNDVQVRTDGRKMIIGFKNEKPEL